jgi:hypothetical protein
MTVVTEAEAAAEVPVHMEGGEENDPGPRPRSRPTHTAMTGRTPEPAWTDNAKCHGTWL